MGDRTRERTEMQRHREPPPLPRRMQESIDKQEKMELGNNRLATI